MGSLSWKGVALLVVILLKICVVVFYLPRTENVTIVPVLVEFEHFANNVSEASDVLSKHFPRVLVVSETLPYPPLRLPSSVQLQLTAPDIDVAAVDRLHPGLTPGSHVLFLPDFVHFVDFSRLAALAAAHQTALLALPAGRVACERVRLDVRRWTLEYGPAEGPAACGGVTGRHGVLVPTRLLWRLPDPFCRPSPECLYMQTSRAGIKVVISPESLLAPTPASLTRRQAEKLRQYRDQRRALFYRRFEVKRVVRAGRSEWHGCSRQTARCFGSLAGDTPEYLYRGRWTPPCCLRHLRRTARHVLAALARDGVRYWLEGGSLLGAVRHGDIIPWDSDVDVGIYQEDIPRCADLHAAVKEPVTDEAGFVWERAPEGKFFRVQFSATNRVHVDIFPFYSRNGTMTKDTWFETHPQDCEFPEEVLTPLEIMPFVGVNASVPNRAREFLELKFGRGVVETPQYPEPAELAFPAGEPGTDWTERWKDEL